jgi:hypothetical protein
MSNEKISTDAAAAKHLIDALAQSMGDDAGFERALNVHNLSDEVLRSPEARMMAAEKIVELSQEDQYSVLLDNVSKILKIREVFDVSAADEGFEAVQSAIRDVAEILAANGQTATADRLLESFK